MILFGGAIFSVFQNVDDKELFVKYKILKNQKFDIIPGSGIDVNFYHYDYCQDPL